ncbi:achacin-like [Ylistrum balloti]|uniref:achacin-like n=1 Tax=Ylistrum balloti TaxID=509963 RepID=UPI002905AAFD|nr:achacin-like [Ylistrum balloti]
MSTLAILVQVSGLVVASMSDPDSCHDVAVVGGGVGGAYTVWRLRNQGLRVGLYEFSDRLGGRYHTHTFPQAPDVPVELGAMRFNKEKHPVLYRTTQKVGLKTELSVGPNPLTNKGALFYLRGRYLRKDDFKGDHVPYNLRPHERRGIHEIYRYLIQHTNFSGNISSIDQEQPYLISEDGVKLEHQTIQEFLRKYLSTEAVEMVSNVIKTFLYNRSAASVMKYIISHEKFAGYDWLKISGGMQQLPLKLVEQFLSAGMKHHLHLNHKLVSISTTGNMNILKFVTTRTIDGETRPNDQFVTVCSRKVILAIPTPALLHINWKVLQKRHIQASLDTVSYHYAVKLYLVYDRHWWKGISNKFKSICGSLNPYCYRQNYCWPKQATRLYCCWCDAYGQYMRYNSDLPLDRTIDFGVSKETGAAVLLVAFSVHDIWNELQKHGDYLWAINQSVSSEVVRHAHLYLARQYQIPVRSIPAPIGGLISQWDDYPYEGSYSSWKIGVEWRQVWEIIHRPSMTDDIFLASGTYWDYDSDIWTESCLEAIDEIMYRYF